MSQQIKVSCVLCNYFVLKKIKKQIIYLQHTILCLKRFKFKTISLNLRRMNYKFKEPFLHKFTEHTIDVKNSIKINHIIFTKEKKIVSKIFFLIQYQRIS